MINLLKLNCNRTNIDVEIDPDDSLNENYLILIVIMLEKQSIGYTAS